MRHVVKVLAIIFLLVLCSRAASAGGSRIALTDICGRTHGCIFVMDQDGVSKTPVYRSDKAELLSLTPSWSPDRESIAFVDHGSLYRIDVDRVTVRPDGMLAASSEGELWSGAGYAGYSGLSRPAWAPEGGLIAVKTLVPQAVCLIDEWGAGDLEMVYSPPAGARLHSGGLSWNSDGTRLAFFVTAGSGGHDLVIVDLLDGGVERIAAADVGAPPYWFQPAWANRGDPRIAFCEDDWIHTYNSETGEVVRQVVEGYSPAWSPDNSEIGLRRSLERGKLYACDLATGKVRMLGNGKSPNWSRSIEEGECAIRCESDRDCDDADPCTGDHCLYSGSCKAYCVYVVGGDPGC
jgi:hypothetical protein